MQRHQYAGEETQQPAHALIRFWNLVIMYPLSKSLSIWGICLHSNGAAGRQKVVRGREVIFIRHLLCARHWSHQITEALNSVGVPVDVCVHACTFVIYMESRKEREKVQCV